MKKRTQKQIISSIVTGLNCLAIDAEETAKLSLCNQISILLGDMEELTKDESEKERLNHFKGRLYNYCKYRGYYDNIKI